MLDLKAKLAAAGLVTSAEVAAAERNRSKRGGPPPAKRSGPAKPAKPQHPGGLDVAALQRDGKAAAYDAIRRALDRNRLDPAHGIPSDQASPFHFTTARGQLSRLTLEPDLHAQLVAGTAAIVAFMSHHGLAHCVAPRPLAEAIAEVFPTWLRVLHGHPGAGQQEAPPAATPDPTTPKTPTM